MGTAQPTGLPVPGRYQISSWATRFMRSAAALLMGFCAMGPGVLEGPAPSVIGLSVSRRLGDGLPSNAARGGGGGAAPGEVVAAWLRGFRAPTASLSPQLRSSPASLPTCRLAGAAALLCGKPWGNLKTLHSLLPLKFRPASIQAKWTNPKRTELSGFRHRDPCSHRLGYEIGHSTPRPQPPSTFLGRDLLHHNLNFV